MGCIIGETGNDQESDRQNSLHEDLNEILSEEKLKEGQTDPLKTSADHRMIAIVDNEEIQKRKRHLEYRKIHEQTRRGYSVSGLNQMGKVTQRFDPNHWIKLGNSSSRS